MVRITCSGANSGNRHELDEIIRFNELQGDVVKPVTMEEDIAGFEYELNRFLTVRDARHFARCFCTITFYGRRLRISITYDPESPAPKGKCGSGKKKLEFA